MVHAHHIAQQLVQDADLVKAIIACETPEQVASMMGALYPQIVSVVESAEMIHRQASDIFTFLLRLRDKMQTETPSDPRLQSVLDAIVVVGEGWGFTDSAPVEPPPVLDDAIDV